MKELKLVLVFILSSFISQAQLLQLGNDIDGAAAEDQFGTEVSISADGNRMAVLAPRHEINGLLIGHVRIYDYDGNGWVQIGADINAEDDRISSISLSADGSRIAIGMSSYRPENLVLGRVRIYELINQEWVQLANSLIGVDSNHYSGSFVTFSSNHNCLIIGGRERVDIAKYNNGNWEITGSIIDEDFSSYITDVSVSSDGNRIAVGREVNDDAFLNGGQVRIYELVTGNWIQMGEPIYGKNIENYFGCSVSLSEDGNRLAVGAFGATTLANGHTRLFEFIDNSWVQIGSDIVGDNFFWHSGYSVSLSADGNRVAIGTVGDYTSGPTGYTGNVRMHDYIGGDWLQITDEVLGEAGSDWFGNSVSMTPDGQYVAVGAYFNDGNGNKSGHVRAFKLIGGLSGVMGRVYNDLDENCIRGVEEVGLQNKKVTINPGDIVAETNHLGYWDAGTLSAGTYTLTVDTTGPWTAHCSYTQTFTISQTDSFTLLSPIGLKSTAPCPDPNISIYMPFMRPCFSDQRIYIEACNNYNASGNLTEPTVLITLDPLLMVTDASTSYNDLGNNQFSFDFFRLRPGECKQLWMDATLSCDAMLEQTLCLQANLTPVDSCIFNTTTEISNQMGNCLTPWDNSNLELRGNCQNDSIIFNIMNIGDDMDCYSPIRLFVDGEINVYDSIQLSSGVSHIFGFPADGRTWRLEVDQHPLYPSNSQPSATIEACGDLSNWTPGLVNIFPVDDADPFVDIYCGVVTGSFDPNDKTGFPLGVGDNNFVLPNKKMEYRIRFQNTGTDTAFTVVIRDTLSKAFDIFSLRSGVSSHNYTFRMYGSRVLEWTFNNILLPDSTTNEPASHGFVYFTVDQKTDLVEGTLLENSAAIYFDFNDPIITNLSTHTINYHIQDFTTATHNINAFAHSYFNIYPNPTTGNLILDLQKQYQQVELNICTITGQQLIRTSYTNVANIPLELSGPPGLYFIQVKTNDGYSESLKIVKQ